MRNYCPLMVEDKRASALADLDISRNIGKIRRVYRRVNNARDSFVIFLVESDYRRGYVHYIASVRAVLRRAEIDLALYGALEPFQRGIARSSRGNARGGGIAVFHKAESVGAVFEHDEL